MALLVALAVIFPVPPAQAAEKVAKLPVSIYCAAHAADLKSVLVKTEQDRYQSIGVSAANIIVAGAVLVEDGRWVLLTETRCAIRKDRRWLTCIYPDLATGRMNIHSLPDRTRQVAAPTE